jgi:hypothetical protein
MELDNISQNFPYLSCVLYQGREYVCIIQNHDDKIMSFYDFQSLRTPEEKRYFLECGDTWWWESNRLLPIHIFLNGKMVPFRYCLKTVAMKDISVVFGPTTSLNNLMKKRIKKRQIQLVKKVD